MEPFLVTSMGNTMPSELDLPFGRSILRSVIAAGEGSAVGAEEGDVGACDGAATSAQHRANTCRRRRNAATPQRSRANGQTAGAGSGPSARGPVRIAARGRGLGVNLPKTRHGDTAVTTGLPWWSRQPGRRCRRRC